MTFLSALPEDDYALISQFKIEDHFLFINEYLHRYPKAVRSVVEEMKSKHLSRKTLGLPGIEGQLEFTIEKAKISVRFLVSKLGSAKKNFTETLYELYTQMQEEPPKNRIKQKTV